MGSPCCPLPRCICHPFSYLTARSPQAPGLAKASPDVWAQALLPTPSPRCPEKNTVLSPHSSVPCVKIPVHPAWGTPNGRAEESSSVSNKEATAWLGTQNCLGEDAVSELHLLPLGWGLPGERNPID
uniref:Uncharacterized protein n=1 Tax=Myotis myotis TaxID=51298 RepID=A0A7J8AMA2_MYOMY|nr:hypothetical protein mMyoMyo1_007994 [Myotis myotis]